MEEKYKHIIQAEIISSNAKDVVELVYELIVNKEFDKKVVRNKAIKHDFNRLYSTSMPVMDIYESLSVTYGVADSYVRTIVNVTK
jgi:hypothetical protein